MQIREFCLLVVVAQGGSAIIEASWLCMYPQQFLGKNHQSSIVYRFICLPQLCCELNLEEVGSQHSEGNKHKMHI